MIEFNCIYAREALEIKKFLRRVESGDIINYIDIFNKLTKNDIYSNEPSDIIIASQIIRLLEKYLVLDEKLEVSEIEDTVIYYVFSELDSEIIDNIKNHVKDLSDKREVVFNCYIKNKDDYSDFHKHFDTVTELKYEA